MKTDIVRACNNSNWCLYPTFKEWKHNITCQDTISKNVYILPLRNENIYPWSWVFMIMECLYPTFKEWKPLPKDFDSSDPVSLFISYL